MADTYDPTLALGQVRLLAFDSDLNNVIFHDVDVTALLALNNQDVRLAAAQAVDIIAGNEAYVQKVIKTADVMTNGSQTAAMLQKYAAELRRQSYQGSGDFVGYFDWIETVNDEFSLRERMVKEFIRSVGSTTDDIGQGGGY